MSQPSQGKPPSLWSAIDRFFCITARGSTVRTEALAGATTFFTMAYILFVNAGVLGSVADREGHKLAFPEVLTVTALSAAVSTLAMGVIANYPFALAAGMGLNAVVAFQLVAGAGLTWAEAMGVVVMEGIVIGLLVLTGLREAIMDAIPAPLKQAIGVGIGLFIAFIGLVTGGIIGKPAAPELRVELGAGGLLKGLPVGVFVIGLWLMGVLVARRMRGALLLGILATTALAIGLNETIAGGGAFSHIAPGVARLPERIAALPAKEHFGLVGAFSFGFVGRMGALSAALAVFALMLGDFFDTMGSVIGLGAKAGFLDEKAKLPGIKRVLFVDSLAAAIGGAMSASSNTTYIESASGIAEGGRTGLANVVTGFFFLLSIFLWPLADVIPPQATGPALVIVGFLMVGMASHIPWDDVEMALPAFLTMILMPFTYSITNGIGAGFVTYTTIKLLRGKSGEVQPLMLLASLAFVVYFGIYYLRNALGLAG